jgi:glycosyltransferase involved in cell wall biosynthesis
MKIICVSTSIIPAPTAHSMQLMKVCHTLVHLNHQVELIVPRKSAGNWDVLAKHYGLTRPFRIRYFRSRAILRRYDFAIAAIHYARRQKPDVVYTWLLPAAVMALWAGIPTVLELHDRITGKVAPLLFNRFIASKTPKRLVVITQALKKIIIRQFPNCERLSNVMIAPNGVELERYRHLPSSSIARKKLGLPDRLTVVYSGGFYAGRGIELLYVLAKRNPAIQFIWAGGTPDSVDTWRHKLAVDDVNNVILTGFIDNQELPQYQAAADILAMPFGAVIAGSSGGNSVEICSPMKMFDYLASGRAIMVSNLPVLHEVLNDANAVLLPPDNEQAWQKSLTELAANQSLRLALGVQAKKDAGRYTWLNRETEILKGFPG